MNDIRFVKNEFEFALKTTTPIIITYIIVGISFGILAYDAGLSLFWTFLSSLIVYSGAGQIALVALLKAGTSLPVLVVMGIALSGRFAFYGISLIDRYKASGKFYPYLIFGLTDEAYSVMISIDYPKNVDQSGVNVLITLFIHIAWTLGSVLGHVFGQSIGVNIPGLDFMLTAFFITAVIGKWKDGSKSAIVFAVVASLASIGIFGRDSFIIPAILFTTIFIVLEGRVRKVRVNG